MKTRKILALILVVLMSLAVFAGCAKEAPQTDAPAVDTPAAEDKPAEEKPADTPAEEKPADDGEIDWSQYHIGFSQDWNQNDWTQMMRDDIIAMCEEVGLKCTVTDAGNDGSKQISDIEDLITLGVDALLISTYHADAIVNATQQAMDAGIPVIVLSSEIPGVEPTVHISADSIATGEICGNTVKEKFPDGANIIHLNGKEGSVVNQMRSEGFHNIIMADDKYKELAEITCNYSRSEALVAMEDQLQVYGDTIDVVYTNNDDMALGAIQAIEDAGLKANVDGGIFVISAADAVYPEVLDVIEEGKMISHYYSTFGVEGVTNAMEILAGKAVEAKQIADAPAVTAANVADFR